MGRGLGTREVGLVVGGIGLGEGVRLTEKVAESGPVLLVVALVLLLVAWKSPRGEM